jgi:hypothetical protein
MSGDCPANPTSCAVTQTGCNATLNCDNGTVNATVSGNSLSFTFEGAQCSGSVTNGSFSGSCTASGTTCSVSGTCSTGKCGTSGSGGGTGVGGTSSTSGGSGGVPPGGSTGTGGTGPGACGDVPYSTDAICESCMQGACCPQMQNCSTGTPCYELISCFATYCSEASDPNCVTQFCPDELAAGGPAADALYNCAQSSCPTECASTSGGGR